MNVSRANEQRIDPAVWEGPQMRQALAIRDMAAVYRLLQRVGVTQRRIAALTAQSQSEISEILNGRQAMAYEVLGRIAEGLGIPRGYMGLAYDPCSERQAASAVPDQWNGFDEEQQAQRLLAHAAQVTIGATVVRPDDWANPVVCPETPLPSRVGRSDVEHIEVTTGTLRNLDYRYGGGLCRDAVLAQLARSQRLLSAECSEQVARLLHRALADQHSLAGWTSFDVGMYGAARAHLARALEQAKHAGEPSLAANVLYRMGRVQLHCGRPLEALRFFQLGQICAQDASCERTVAMLCANEAWAYALLGDAGLALKSLTRARDEFARASGQRVAPWLSFFGVADLDAMSGMVFAALGGDHLEAAVGRLTSAIQGRDPGMARSRVFEQTTLATVRLKAGDLHSGLKEGHQAVTSAVQLHSVRVVERLAPLRAAAVERSDNADCRDLAHRISTVRAA
ncbi:helix-turn-helix transcriptional regulator [Thermopolyspora sp. NPDC052614]|uniref:helix-turn-helix domain-containing protein n=1 Tax=Thermopolyspora sp. NPDC052614 TaxID=3155682 RepID=UPI0034246424